MTFKEKYDKEEAWDKKVIIMALFHNTMLLKHGKRWTICHTARSMEISIGTVSENLRLADALHNGLDECKSRIEALKRLGMRK